MGGGRKKVMNGKAEQDEVVLGDKGSRCQKAGSGNRCQQVQAGDKVALTRWGKIKVEQRLLAKRMAVKGCEGCDRCSHR